MVPSMQKKTSQKFLFENAFDQPLVTEDELEEEEFVPPPPTFSEEDLAAARAHGFVEGRQAGIAETQTNIDARMAELIGQMVAEVQTLGTAHADAARAIEAKMLALALAIARKVVPTAARANAEDAVEDIIRECLPKLRDEPRIVVRVHAAVMEPLQKRIDAISVRSAFPGDVILLEDEGLAEVDCRVEWSDGGAERTVAEIWAEIERAVEGHLAALGALTTTHDAMSEVQGEPDGPAQVNEENLNG